MPKQTIPEALQWIVDHHYPVHPNEDPRVKVRIKLGKDVVAHEYLRYGDVVTVSDAGISRWYRPFSEPGAPRIGRAGILDLFDFMTIVIWPKWIGGWFMERFIEASPLNGAERAAIDRYEVLKAESRQYLRADIRELLSDQATLLRLYLAAQRSDVQALRACEAATESSAGVNLAAAAGGLRAALEAGDARLAGNWRSSLIATILMSATESWPVLERLSWQSTEYHQSCDAVSQQSRLVAWHARLWHVRAFEQLCLSDELLRINGLFGTARHDYEARVAAFAAEWTARYMSAGLDAY